MQTIALLLHGHARVPEHCRCSFYICYIFTTHVAFMQHLIMVHRMVIHACMSVHMLSYSLSQFSGAETGKFNFTGHQISLAGAFPPGTVRAEAWGAPKSPSMTVAAPGRSRTPAGQSA